MKVLVLGGAGFVGRAVVQRLLDTEGFNPVVASRRPGQRAGLEAMVVNALDVTALTRACESVDAVINCVAGDVNTIIAGSRSLVNALRKSSSRPIVVHMSTMSVYGSQEGLVNEATTLVDDIGWYGSAKICAEQEFESLARSGGRVFILRPGCVYGPDSSSWTDRIGRLLKARRLGDLGPAGDGWSNLVHVADIAKACLCCLQGEQLPGQARIFNLSAPDSPRWNQYFHDFAMEIGATPFRYLTHGELLLRSKLMAPPLKVLERVCQKLRVDASWLPDSIPPSLLGLWGQQIKLSSSLLSTAYNFQWTPYQVGLNASCASFQSGNLASV